MSTPRERASVSELEFASPVTIGPLAAPDGSLTLADAGSTTKILVRAGPDTAAATALAVPYGQSREGDDGILICGSRPDEWTLYAPTGRSAQVAATVPTGGFVTVIDLTHGRAMIRMSGRSSIAALGKVCNIDFDDDMVPAGAVFSAAVAGVSCDLVRDDQDGQRSYFLTCERSFGRYVFVALADAGIEFGIDVPEGWALH